MAAGNNAPIRPSVEVDGLARLQRELRKIEDDITRQAIKDANKAAAQKVVDSALPHVPVRTGRLKSSVRALAGIKDARAAGGGARVPYAPAVHWGTGPRPGRRGPHNIDRNPFLLDAADRERDNIEEEYLNQIDEILRKFR